MPGAKTRFDLRAGARGTDAPPEYVPAAGGRILRRRYRDGNAGAAAASAAPSENMKPTNPKDALGVLKTPMSVFPLPVLFEASLGMLEGALKYGRHNYRVIGVRGSVYFDATCRHLFSWWEGEDLDPDSKLSHITKAITSLVVLRDAMIRGNWVDDRPPKSDPALMQSYNAHVKVLLEKYPEPVKPYTERVTAAVTEPVK